MKKTCEAQTWYSTLVHFSICVQTALFIEATGAKGKTSSGPFGESTRINSTGNCAGTAVVNCAEAAQDSEESLPSSFQCRQEEFEKLWTTIDNSWLMLLNLNSGCTGVLVALDA